MKNLIITLLLLAALVPVSVESRTRKKRKEAIAQSEQQTPQAVKADAAPQKIDTVDVNGAAAAVTEPLVNDMTLNLTPGQADSLVAEWIERQRHDAYEEFFSSYVAEDTTVVQGATPDSVYKQRLFDLLSPVPLAYNSVVRNYIDRYVGTHSSLIGRVLGLSKYYFPIFEEELLKAGLPVELRVLPIIESALQTTATSRAGAVGLWQFMPATGKSYGLEINSMVDERRDPRRATEAACRYLKDLYRIYNDWTLAIAAYNCGPGNINKAISRSGAEGKGFWELYDWLLSETRGYMPSFIGATYAYTYHDHHGIRIEEAPIPLAVDTVRISRPMHMEQISSTIDLPLETLRMLNPQYKMDIIPATTRSYTLVLPQRSVAQYIAAEKEIFAKDSTYLKEYINPVNIEKVRTTPATQYYKVKSGDTLGAIARRYNVSIAQLKRWNNIKNADRLSIGQRLRVK